MINAFPLELSERIDLLQKISEAADNNQLKLLLEIVTHNKNEKSKATFLHSPAGSPGH